MANLSGINYESAILNAKEEAVVEQMSTAIMDYGQPNHGDLINDPIMAFNSVFDFVAYWQGIYPMIGQRIVFSKQYAFTPMWGSLTSISALRGGISFVQLKYFGQPMPKELEDAILAFEDLLVNEANEIGSGKQSFVSERYEHLQR